MDVNKLPEWTDCPLRDMVPVEYVIRKGLAYGVEIVAFVWEGQMHVDCLAASFGKEAIAPMLNNLAGLRFEIEYPNCWIGMFRKQARAVNGEYKFTPAELKMIARHDKLHPFSPPFMIPTEGVYQNAARN